MVRCSNVSAAASSSPEGCCGTRANRRLEYRVKPAGGVPILKTGSRICAPILASRVFPCSWFKSLAPDADSPIAQALNAVQLLNMRCPIASIHLAVTSAIDLPPGRLHSFECRWIAAAGNRLAIVAAALTSGTPGVQIGPRLKQAIQRPEPPDRVLIDLSFTGVTGRLAPRRSQCRLIGSMVPEIRTKSIMSSTRPQSCGSKLDSCQAQPSLQPGETVPMAHGPQTLLAMPLIAPMLPLRFDDRGSGAIISTVAKSCE